MILIILDSMQKLAVTSPEFAHNSDIPSKYTCEGQNISPPLEITGIPKEAKTLAFIVDDPDAPMGTFDHLIAWNLPVAGNIPENAVFANAGKNSAGRNSYMGPCPPSGRHRYFFKVYALGTSLELPSGTNKKQLLEAMGDNILGYGELVGLYRKKK